MNIGTGEVAEMNPIPDPPYDPSDAGLSSNTTSHINNNKDDGDGGDGDDDGDAVDGPTVEAHVNLAKTARKYYLTRHHPIHVLTYIYSA
jgi:hypothetical protein